MKDATRKDAFLRALADGDWPTLIELAKGWGCLPDAHAADDPHEYTWKGNHHEDARYTAPARFSLIANLCKHLTSEATR